MARTHINDRDCLPIRTVRSRYVFHAGLASTTHVQVCMYLDGVSQQKPTERIDGEGRNEVGRNRSL